MISQAYEKARTFLYRNARPLDMALFQYHFEGGTKQAVLTALAAYQIEDGGFGHALEPDAWNPNSSPIQTWAATEILREIDFTDNTHPLMQGIMGYLESKPMFNGHSWGAVVPSMGDYPHAPWWRYDSDSACRTDYNPTACLAGFIIRFGEKGSGLYPLACRIAKEASDAYFAGDLLGDMHTAGCYIRLLEYCEEAGYMGIDTAALGDRLKAQVKRCITTNTAEWETGYICKPSQFICGADSIFYADNRDIADYECDFILRTQEKDGSWPIPWRWATYPEEWAISKRWWKGKVAIANLLYLKGMGRLLST